MTSDDLSRLTLQSLRSIVLAFERAERRGVKLADHEYERWRMYQAEIKRRCKR